MDQKLHFRHFPQTLYSYLYYFVILISSQNLASCDTRAQEDSIIMARFQHMQSISSLMMIPCEEAETKLYTGLEFLENEEDIPANWDQQYFFTSKLLEQKRKVTKFVVDLVQNFIRNIKGLKIDNPIRVVSISKAERRDPDDKKPDWLHNPFEFQRLVDFELGMYELLKQFYKSIGPKNSSLVLESYLADFEDSIIGAKCAVNASKEEPWSPDDLISYIVSHPLAVYRTIRRFAEDLPAAMSQLKSQGFGFIDFKDLDDEWKFPKKDDLLEALEALRRMQMGNNLKTQEMGEGTFENVKTGIGLNALHALELGFHYLLNEDYDLGIQWIHFGFEKGRKISSIEDVNPEIFELFDALIRYAVDKHNQEFKVRVKYRWSPGVFTIPIALPFKPEAYKRQLDTLKPLALQEIHNSTWNWAISVNVKRLCAGEKLQSKAEIAKLKCWYERNLNKYWLINPLQVEMLNKEPKVLQIHNFIGDGLAERMRNRAAIKLTRSKVVDKHDPKITVPSANRTSSQTWLSDFKDNGKFLWPLTKRLELATNLVIGNQIASDQYQVAVYGPAQYYEVHLDAFEDRRRAEQKGNRITTIMGYLSDVEIGGRTAFPVLGTFAEPTKGSILIWNNLHRNGLKRDKRTWHGACPVVLGIKWITNKWVYYKENMLRYQCTLNPEE